MKLVITARDFSATGASAMALLREAGWEITDYSGESLGPGTDPALVAERIGGADAAIIGLEPLNAAVLRRCPRLKIVSRRGIGYDSIDLAACRTHGVAAVRAVGTVEAAVAEHVMAYVLHFARHVAAQSASMHRGEWCRTMMPGAKGRVLGLVGFGGIGKEIARRAVPFGMEVRYFCRHPQAAWAEEYHVSYCDWDTLLSDSDYLSINVPLTERTRGMFGAEEFRRMKRESVLINIARGPIVDVPALRDALLGGLLRGAAVDVFDSEPCTTSPLLDCPNAVLTPHTATYTTENFQAMNLAAARNIIDFFAGTLNSACRLV